MEEPRRIWWARPRKLCALERPGGGGAVHRPERRAAEIEYLRSRGGAAGRVDDAHAPQPGRLRGGGARLAPRAGGAPPRTGRRRSRSCCRCCAASSRAAARWPCTATATRTSWPRSAPRTCTSRAGWTRRSRWRARPAAGLDRHAGGVRAGRRATGGGGRVRAPQRWIEQARERLADRHRLRLEAVQRPSRSPPPLSTSAASRPAAAAAARSESTRSPTTSVRPSPSRSSAVQEQLRLRLAHDLGRAPRGVLHGGQHRAGAGPQPVRLRVGGVARGGQQVGAAQHGLDRVAQVVVDELGRCRPPPPPRRARRGRCR